MGEAQLKFEPQVIKAGEKQNVEYAIPLWLRDLQIRYALTRIKDRVQPVEEPRTEPVAIVCFGPSLRDTWEQVRGFKHIITCSGAHKFLVNRGIVPNWHVEVDPREHKIKLIGTPQRDTEYWISSTCHKAVFDHLEGHNVKLWHVFDGDYESGRLIPPGEWALTGGCGVGLRAFTCATFLGFRDIHVFGMDGNESEDGKKHADVHPNEPIKHALVEFPEGSGRIWRTTPSMLEAARQTVHEMEQLSKAKFTFYGDGLVQAMVKQWTPGQHPAAIQNIDAIKKPELITPEFRALNAQLHADNALYGAGGHRHAETVKKLAEGCKAESVLDYGCGKGTLAAHLPFPIWEYDPAVPGKDELPRPADLVLCFDVLEHVEPDLLRNVLGNLSKLVKKVGYFVVHSGAAKKTYADGRNAHLIQQPQAWWEKKMAAYFDIGQCFTKGPEVHIVVGPRTAKAKVTEPVTQTQHDGTTVDFVTPNQLTVWRAQSLISKEPATIAWIDTFAAGEVLYDIGANVGGYTCWAAKRRGVKVVAFEPEAGNYALLCKNMALNAVEGVAYPLALTDQTRLSEIFLASREVGSSCNSFGEPVGFDLKARDGIRQGAVGMTLDSVIYELRDHQSALATPSHIKIDVDGFEHKVVRGMHVQLASGTIKSLLVEVNANLPEHRDMLDFLASFGYTHDPAQFEAAQRKDGAFKGCGECVFTKCDPVEKYVLDKLANAEMQSFPFPHLYVEDVFPQPITRLPGNLAYQSLMDARGTPGYPQRYVATAPLSLAWMNNGKLRALLDQRFGVKSRSDETLLLRDFAGYEIGPHTDTPAKGITALFYLTPDWTEVEHGTTLYEPINKQFTDPEGKHHKLDGFKEAWTAPGKPNSVLIFARTDNSFHGCKRYQGQFRHRDILLWDSKK